MGFITNLLGSGANSYNGNVYNYNPIMDQASQSQADLSKQLTAESQGQGPSPATQLLQNATQTNAANAAGQINSVRGINPALAAVEANRRGAELSQQAAGQGAALRAQEQLAAQQQLQQGNLGMFGMSSAGAQQQNQINSGVASQNTQVGAGLMGSLGSALGMGGIFKPPGGGDGGGSGMIPSSEVPMMMAHGGKVHPASHAGRHVAAPKMDPKMMAMLLASQQGGAGPPQGPMPMLAGGSVPGKAKAPGDSPKNDIVPAMLSPGEVVVPRSSANDPDKARAFVAHVRRRAGRTQPYRKVVKAKGGK